ncbi:Putative thiosulfate sulfurtransferase SseB [Frondihabitans sp. 762G35]|uniref:sulfurtransferase n=1 Tax=Frondihabitans sp. 762G35 TaxID=1446794 RepID=UPI000D21F792|nr:sulfurtransferase [Frondihabitans sp. 762G35]ARC58590.1 Putative thiosulfate sulfurtransferase SseB [Frondihabitans sp. 762G35]
MILPAVVQPEWYRDHADEVVLVDVRWYSDGRDGEAAYRQGHLPGAVWVSIDGDLSSPADPGGARHPLPTPEHFAASLGNRGIGQDATVIAYDDTSGSTAGRLVWLLRALGQPAALLDGGMSAWHGDLERGDVTRAPVTRDPRPWPADRFVDQGAVADKSAFDVLVDARARERYTGEAEVPLDPRHGHVPGAVNVPWASNLDENGFFRHPALLRELYAEQGIDVDSRVAVYCGSGVTACTDLLALEYAGIQGARLYPGSWSEWGADAGSPMETGDATATA